MYKLSPEDSYTANIPLFKFVTDGPVTVYYEVTKDGYSPVRGSETVEIKKRILDVDSFTYTPIRKVYDGTRNAPEGFNVIIPEG